MTAYTRFGAFCGNVDCFDATAFRIAKNEAATMDPQHRLLLEATAGALADGKVSSAAQTTGGFGAVLETWCCNCRAQQQHSQGVSRCSGHQPLDSPASEFQTILWETKPACRWHLWNENIAQN